MKQQIDVLLLSKTFYGVFYALLILFYKRPDNLQVHYLYE